MSSRPSEKENVPFTQSPTSPKVLREAFQPSPRPPMSPQQVKWSPRAPVSPRSSPNRSRGHLRPANLHPPSLLTRSRTQRVSFAQKDSHHVYTTPLRSLPSYSSKPPAFIAARSILKAKTPERVLVPEVTPEAPPHHGRDMSPTPDDPLQCPTYLSSPVSVIVSSVSVTPQPNRIDSEYGNSYGPLPMSLHDIAEAYTLMLARMRLQAMTVGPDGNPTEVEISSDLPILEPIRKHHTELSVALARDVGRALIRSASFSPSPYQHEEFNDWSSDYSSDVFGSSSPPGSPSGPTQRRGLTAAEVKYARDLSLVSQSAIRVLAVIFHEPAISSHFTDQELAEMLKVLITIPNTMPLPTPNPRKTHTAALWALQMVRLPLSALKQPGVAQSLFDALQMAIQGKLGREGKKGSTSEGLTALQCLSTHYPCIFAPILPTMVADVIRCLSSPMVLIRQRAALALGGIVQGLFDWEEEEEVASNDAGRKFDPKPISEVRRTISEAILDAFDLQTGAKNAIMLKAIKDIISQFGPEASAQAPRAGDTPHWAFSVLASLVTLLERNFFKCGAMHTAIATCAMIAFNAKKAAIRAAGGLLWSCVVWAWKRFDEHDPTRGEGEDSLKNEKLIAQVVVEHVGFGVIAALMGAMDRSETVKARRLRRVTRTVRAMITENCAGAPELFARLLANEESTTSSPLAIDRKLVPTNLLTQPLVGADLKALGIAVNSNLAQGVKAEDVRPLSMDERVSEWSLLFAAWKQFPGTIPMTKEGEAPELLFTTWRAILLATTHVKEHIPCFVSIAEALTAFANSKYDEPSQMAITLNFVRRLWGIVHEVFFNPLSSNNLLADFSADLIQTLAQRPPDLGNKVVREAWVTLLGEVLASGALDSADTLCDVLPESLWGSVYAGVVGKYAEEPNFEAGLVLCGVPFNESYSWVLSEEDWTAWSSLAHALIVNEGDQVFSNLLTMVTSGHAASIPTASTVRPLSILLSFSELPVTDSDPTFLNLLGMANDRLRGEYGGCLSPDALAAILELISALKGILSPDPVCLEIIEAVQSGMMMWIEDDQLALSDQEFNDGPILFYAHAMQGLSSLPTQSLDLNKLAPFLASAFARIPPPGAGPLAFSLFWNQKFHGAGVPVPEILKPCLRGILNVEELVEGGISLGTQLEETQTQADNKSAEIADTSMESPNTSIVGAHPGMEKADRSKAETNAVKEKCPPVAQESNTETESSVEEIVGSSVEETDQLADDLDLVEETIVYEPPKRAKSTTPEVVAKPLVQEDSQCVPDSQPKTTETTEPSLTPSQILPVCESPRKRKYEDLSPPSKRAKGLFIADPGLGGALSTLRFPTPASLPGSSSGSVIEESVFYSPSKYDIPPPAWSPTGTLQPLPDVSSPKAKGTNEADDSLDADTSADISEYLNKDLADLPDITMSLPSRKKRMTLVVEVPRVQDVLKRWSSDSATRATFGPGISSTPKSAKTPVPERARRTRSWSKIPSVMDSSVEFESTPSRPAKRRRSDRENIDSDRTITPNTSSRVLRSPQKGLPPQTTTPKPAESVSDMFNGESPEETPSLRRVKSLPLAEKFAGLDLKKVGRVATLALARTDSQTSNASVEMKDPEPEPESQLEPELEQLESGPPNAPVTRSASLEALIIDAEALAKLDVTELLKQQEMLAAMREQVAKALELKREMSVGSGAKSA
ncbi:Titin [Rhizoctonia solani]|uniref:Titin n=1 Tax=Rhizoctonia solani TaxID=456999 RepID=A0A0K6GE41_9AGAM|nr:Titin [Rhizoctonia solani]